MILEVSQKSLWCEFTFVLSKCMDLMCGNKTFMSLPRLWESAHSPACYFLSPAQNTLCAVCVPFLTWYQQQYLTMAGLNTFSLKSFRARSRSTRSFVHCSLEVCEDHSLGHLQLQFISQLELQQLVSIKCIYIYFP